MPVSESKKLERRRAQHIIYRKKNFKPLTIQLSYRNDEDVIYILQKSGGIGEFVRSAIREKGAREGLDKGFVKGSFVPPDVTEDELRYEAKYLNSEYLSRRPHGATYISTAFKDKDEKGKE